MCVTPRGSSNGRYIETMLSHCCGNVASMSCSEDVVSTPRDSSNSATLRGCCPIVAMLCQCCVVRMLYQCFVIVATSLFDFRHRRNSEALTVTRLPKECFISLGFEEQSFFSLLEQMLRNLLIEVRRTRCFSLHLECWRILKDSYFIRYIYTRWICLSRWYVLVYVPLFLIL